MNAEERSESARSAPRLLAEILAVAATLDTRRTERGMVEGRRTSAPLSRRTPIDLDALDAQNDARRVMRKWAGQIQMDKHDTFGWCAEDVIRHHWDWAIEQTWGPAMVAEMESLRDRLVNGGRTVRLVLCPVCRLPVRADTFVADHRACIDTHV